MPAYGVDEPLLPPAPGSFDAGGTELDASEPGLAEPLPTDPGLTDRIARDLALGRRVTTLTWLVALAHAGLGFVALRQAALLVDVDSSLVTTGAIENLGSTATALRWLLVALVVVVVTVGLRWAWRATATMETLAAAGVVDGGPAPVRAQGFRRLGILLRPAGVPVDGVTGPGQRVRADRRLAEAAIVATLLAAAIGIVAAVSLARATGVDEARASRWIAGLAAGAWLLATVLTGALAADIVWRIAVAARAAGVYAPMTDAPGRLTVRLAPALIVFVGLVPIALNAPGDRSVGCASTTLECAAVEVPVDHAAGAASGSFRLVYGVHRAYGDRVGTLVVAVGGPGASGIESADARIGGFDPRLLDRYDIVFWDQRGVARSDGHDCPISGGIYSAVETTAESARNFVDACLKEADTGTTGLGRYATAQAAEDIESIREQLGLDRFALYGESYGTELAQVYAAAHSDRLTTLILDGAVDLTLSANDFWSAATRSFDRSLGATFDACEADLACSADVAHPADAYDRLVRGLKDGDRTIEYTDPDGVTRGHGLSHDAVESAVDSLLYEPAGRMLIQRAVAASDRGDDVPIAKLADLFGPGISPVSVFAYHAVLCADYRVSPTANVHDVDAVLVNGQRSGALSVRTDEIYLAQVPCLFWPIQPSSAARPAALTGLPVPILVLAATLDPITPVELGRAIADRAADGYLVETSGGAHVTFGRGDTCVDDAVIGLLVDGRPPRSRVVSCEGVVADEYVPLATLDADAFKDALDAMVSAERELLADPLYLFWDQAGTIRIGCRFGGTVGITNGFAGTTFDFDGCELADGMALDGSGEVDGDTSDLTLDVTFDGGHLTYTSGDERSVEGTFRGRHVDEHD
jgi:pimeloyl-ACP methyl ester carboxylesterase